MIAPENNPEKVIVDAEDVACVCQFDAELRLWARLADETHWFNADVAAFSGIGVQGLRDIADLLEETLKARSV